ncbi:MAG TPA: hypothetical protein VLM78_02890 [Anaerolineales bacterium]|nr:hypothetical protein [Anaerolineales bacterium]
MSITSKPLAVIIFIVLFGGIALSAALGAWQTESTKVAATFTEGEFAGLPNPADIRGSYTFGDVEKNFGVPAATLATAFALPPETDAAAFAAKNLETIYANLETEIGTASVRLFVALYTGLPFDLSTDIYLPSTAVDILKAHGTLSPEQSTYLDAHSVILDLAPATAPAAIATESTERLVKGKTTFQEILDWGVPQDVIEQIIGAPLPATSLTVKDYCIQQGLDFETIKPALQMEVDKISQ